MERKPVRILIADDKLILLCDDGTMWIGQQADAPDVEWRQMTPPPADTNNSPIGFSLDKK